MKIESCNNQQCDDKAFFNTVIEKIDYDVQISVYDCIPICFRLLKSKILMIAEHWLADARYVPSPNFNERPNENDISLVVIHCISLPPNEFGNDYIDDLFCNRLNPNTHPYFREIHTLQVSAHLLIRRNGECVQYVPFNKRAWHAGVSNYEGRENCNDFSIGIELEGCETIAYTDAQYKKLNEVLAALFNVYPRLSNITGHADIAPTRKTDPGVSFDWARISAFGA